MSIKFVDIAKERRWSVMKCERSVITMTLLRLSYLAHSLDNRAITFTTETGLIEAWGATRTSLLALFNFSV